MELFSQAILHALEAFQSEHTQGPTVSELAISLGIPSEFGRDRLAERVQRQVVLGRVSHCEGHFALTSAGRRACSSPAVHITPARLSQPPSHTPAQASVELPDAPAQRVLPALPPPEWF
jgi:hypothetical protein